MSGEVVKKRKNYPKTPLRKLEPHHYKALELKLEGRTYREMSKEMGFAVSTIKGWFREPIINNALREMTEDVMDSIRAKLVRGAETAANTLVRMSKSEDISPTVFYAARDILDRVGLKAGSKVELTGPGGGPIQIEHNVNIKDKKRILEAALRAVEVLDEEGNEQTIYEAEVIEDDSEE